ncbi:hypothetical protein POM88_023761 [Heracleum sosnowskyi]|uniref:Uncharacterized protein n=1 Tax=Heracleum sosnowskyi TaxID=360622 RepID=A0AAD8MUQ4_9APIA|nr:hypothetical protein POM88_023761 [Heracleum sosnowskyi]
MPFIKCAPKVTFRKPFAYWKCQCLGPQSCWVPNALDFRKKSRNAHYLKSRLRNAGIRLMLNELSSTVVFECPPDEEFIRKWQLACQGDIAHFIVVPNMTVEKQLDKFLDELFEKCAVWYKNGTLQSLCVASKLGNDDCLWSTRVTLVIVHCQENDFVHCLVLKSLLFVLDIEGI